MKTSLKTLAAVATLFIIGATNINATADYRRVMNDANILEQESSLSIESWMTNDDLWAPKTASENVEHETSLKVEAWMTNTSLWK